MSLFIFVEYRISALFVLGYIFLFSIQKYDKKRSFGILLFCYLIMGMLDWWDIYIMQKTTNSTPVMLLQIILVQTTCQLFFAYRDLRALFT